MGDFISRDVYFHKLQHVVSNIRGIMSGNSDESSGHHYERESYHERLDYNEIFRALGQFHQNYREPT